MKKAELDTVKTIRTIMNGDKVIPENTYGVIVLIHKNSPTIEVEFFDDYAGVLTLEYGKDVI